MPNHYPADLERDLLIVEASAADLKDNLLEDSIYWTLRAPRHSHHILPKGTLGGLLMRLHRLGALDGSLTPEQRERLHAAAATVREGLQTWAAQAEEMALREIKARLDSWTAYLQEAESDPDSYIAEYPTQVQGRVALDFLLEYAGDAVSGEIQGYVVTADNLLRSISVSSPFVWDKTLIPAYPERRFWWLYVQPVEI
jgi:hypothetical protein